MDVKFITLASNGKRHCYRELGQAIGSIDQSKRFHRIAFGGVTSKGRSGVALRLPDGKVTGHKMEPIPSELLNLVRHVPLRDALTGLNIFASGEDVLIGDQSEGVLLRWNGAGIEVFASGDDSYH